MDGLTAADLTGLLGFVQGLYEAHDFDGYVGYVLHALPALVRADLTSYNEMDPVRGTSLDHLDRPELNTPEAGAIWEAHMAEHPALAHQMRSGDGSARTIGEFLSDRQFRQTGLYAEHYRPKELAYVLATILERTGPRVIGIGLHRNGIDYTPRERTMVELLRPHLAMARRNALALSRLRRRAGQAGAPEILRFDAQHRISGPSARAIGLLSAYVAAPLHDRLPDDLARWVDTPTGPADDAPQVRLPFVCDGPAGRLTIHLIEGSGERYLLLEEHRAPGGDALRTAGLTARERDVVLLLTRGKPNAEIAADLGISERTVEKHLEHVLTKLGVDNRTAVAAFALEAIAG